MAELEDNEIRDWPEGQKPKAHCCPGHARYPSSRITWRKEVTMKYEVGDLQIG